MKKFLRSLFGKQAAPAPVKSASDLIREENILHLATLYTMCRPDQNLTSDVQIARMVESFSDPVNGSDSMSLFSGLLYRAICNDYYNAPHDVTVTSSARLHMTWLEALCKSLNVYIQKPQGLALPPETAKAEHRVLH